MYIKDILLLIIIFIILLVLMFIIKPQPISGKFNDSQKAENAVKEFINRLGIKTVDKFTNYKKEYFSDKVYLSSDDISEDPVDFMRIVCGGINFNYDDIYSILKQNGLDKRPEVILNEKKNNIDKFFYNKSNKNYPLVLLALCTTYNLADMGTNDLDAAKYSFINYLLKAIFISNIFHIDVSPDTTLEINEDYLTSDKIKIYFRNSKNKDVPISQATKGEKFDGSFYYVEIPDSESIPNLIKNIAPDIIKVSKNIITLANLLFARKLIILNENNVDAIIPESITNSFNSNLKELRDISNTFSNIDINSSKRMIDSILTNLENGFDIDRNIYIVKVDSVSNYPTSPPISDEELNEMKLELENLPAYIEEKKLILPEEKLDQYKKRIQYLEDTIKREEARRNK